MELMASNNMNNMHFHGSSLATCWDALHHHYLHNLGLLNSNISPYNNGIEEMSYVTSSSPMMLLPYVGVDHNNTAISSDDQHLVSTGYLEDALIEVGLRFKRRRLGFNNDEGDHVNQHSGSQFLPHFTCDELSYLSDYWTSDNNMQLEEELSHDSFLSHHLHYSSIGEETIEKMKIEGMKRKGEEKSIETKSELLLSEQIIISNKSNSKKFLEVLPSNSKEMIKSNPNNFTFNSLSSGYTTSDSTYSTDSSLPADEKKKRKVKKERPSDNPTKMVYPFGLVKPGGSEGEITLKDINKRILMPPTRPLKHPVGNFACRPAMSPHGPGLSGKAVVALTRIHTHGRGTITIIRTKD